jgi:hypothetical protein
MFLPCTFCDDAAISSDAVTFKTFEHATFWSIFSTGLNNFIKILVLKRGDLDADARDNWRIFPGKGAWCASYASGSLACVAVKMRAIIGAFFQEMGACSTAHIAVLMRAIIGALLLRERGIVASASVTSQSRHRPGSFLTV